MKQEERKEEKRKEAGRKEESSDWKESGDVKVVGGGITGRSQIRLEIGKDAMVKGAQQAEKVETSKTALARRNARSGGGDGGAKTEKRAENKYNGKGKEAEVSMADLQKKLTEEFQKR